MTDLTIWASNLVSATHAVVVHVHTFDAEAVPNVVTPSTDLQSCVAATPLKISDET